ncbi:hypothetical protein PMIN03_013059, partial [Paraphaeosphaeria minitans]
PLESLNITKVYPICIDKPTIGNLDLDGTVGCVKTNGNSCELDGNLGTLEDVCVNQECMEAMQNV